MPNFSTNISIIVSPVWVENTGSEPVSWRYDSEYTTFPVGMYRDLVTEELWPMDMAIAVHFAKSLPTLKIHTIKPVKSIKKEKLEPEALEEKPIAEMSMQELRHLGKLKGKTFRVGISKAEIVAELSSAA